MSSRFTSVFRIFRVQDPLHVMYVHEHSGAHFSELKYVIIFSIFCLHLEEALQDLSGFDMIWVISHMHLNNGWNRKVRPPRLPEERKGLFSTRSPHRPNAVALSSLRVSRVDAPKGRIYVRGLDLLDGEPYSLCVAKGKIRG